MKAELGGRDNERSQLHTLQRVLRGVLGTEGRQAGCRDHQELSRSCVAREVILQTCGVVMLFRCCPQPGLLPRKEGAGEEGGSRHTGWATFSRRKATEQRLQWDDVVIAAAFLDEEHLRIEVQRGRICTYTEAEVEGLGGRKESDQ